MSTSRAKCPKCGSEEFKMAKGKTGLSDKATCAKCGYSNTRRGMLEPQIKKAKDDAVKKLRDAFKGLR